MSKPKLYIFAISHYCEKARWALDYLDIDYDVVHLALGLHKTWTKRNGLASATLPILDTATQKGLIQGSKNIIDWAETVTASNRTLTPNLDRDSCLQIEKRLDEVSGVHTRRMFYSETLIEHSASVRSIFIQDLPIRQKLLISTLWPIARRSMIQSMNLGFDKGLASKKIIDEELTWLDNKLSDGRRFLIGEEFTRADLTASSLFARLSTFALHPAVSPIDLPPRLRSTAQEWSQRPSLRFVRQNYKEFR